MRFHIACSLILLQLSAWAQHIPLNNTFQLELEAQGTSYSALKPILKTQTSSDNATIKPLTYNDSLVQSSIAADRSWFIRKLFRASLVEIKDSASKVSLEINPLLNVYAGRDLEDTTSTTLYNNTRGFELTGRIGDKLFFGSRFYENQAVFPGYITSYVNATQVVPGQGRTKPFKTTGFDFAQATGYVTWMPKKWLHIELGNGKHFVGHGYRSMLLSDQSFSYPYLRVGTSLLDGKLQVDMISATLQNLNRIPRTSATEPLFQRKGATFFVVNYKPVKWLQVGLFEATMWQVQDTSGSLPFQWMRLNPVPMVNTAVNGLDGVNNGYIGLSGEVRPVKWAAAYGQLGIDKVRAMKYAYQMGIKAYWWKFTLRAEYNSAQDFMYRADPVLQNYSHYNESLAHPVGAYFDEVLLQLNFRHKRWFARAQYNTINYRDFGNNIFMKPDAIPVTTNEHKIDVVKMEAGWIINPINQMCLFGGVLQRTETISSVKNKTLLVHVGIRTNLRNLYYDF